MTIEINKYIIQVWNKDTLTCIGQINQLKEPDGISSICANASTLFTGAQTKNIKMWGVTSSSWKKNIKNSLWTHALLYTITTTLPISGYHCYFTYLINLIKYQLAFDLAFFILLNVNAVNFIQPAEFALKIVKFKKCEILFKIFCHKKKHRNIIFFVSTWPWWWRRFAQRVKMLKMRILKKANFGRIFVSKV